MLQHNNKQAVMLKHNLPLPLRADARAPGENCPALPTAKRQTLRSLGVTRDGRAMKGLLACVEALTRDGSLWANLLFGVY